MLSVSLADSMDTIQLIFTSSERRGAEGGTEGGREGGGQGTPPPTTGFMIALPKVLTPVRSWGWNLNASFFLPSHQNCKM